MERKIYRNSAFYLTASAVVTLVFAASCIMLFGAFPFSLKYFYFYFLFLVWCAVAFRIIVKECTSLLIVDDSGVKTVRSLKNVQMTWLSIARIEYCGKRRTRNERIVLHAESSQRIYISLHRKNYLDAFRTVTDECRKKNPNALIDQDLLERVAHL